MRHRPGNLVESFLYSSVLCRKWIYRSKFGEALSLGNLGHERRRCIPISQNDLQGLMEVVFRLLSLRHADRPTVSDLNDPLILCVKGQRFHAIYKNYHGQSE